MRGSDVALADTADLVPRLLDIKQAAEQRGVRIDIHLTDEPVGEKVDSFVRGRPDLPTVINSAFDSLSGSLFIAGPFISIARQADVQLAVRRASPATCAMPTLLASFASPAARPI